MIFQDVAENSLGKKIHYRKVRVYVESLGSLSYKLINFFEPRFCSAIKQNVKIKYLEKQENAI